MPTKERFVALTVTPGVPCKVILPPCSALSLANAALAAQPGPSFGRCHLECDLATHSFVVCSLLTTGVLQASLDVTITNDPDETAWFFLNAKGPHAFHVVGKLVVDTTLRAKAGSAAASKSARASAPPPRLAAPLPAASAPRTKRPARAGTGAVLEDMIEVLLPDNDELGFDAPSDADSEDFIEYMSRKRPAATAAAPVRAKEARRAGGGGAAARGGARGKGR